MNIEKLDTLLQSKLQWVESEVHDNELNSIFEKMGIRKKGPGIYFMLGVSVFLLCAGLIAYNAVPKASVASLADESILTTEQSGMDKHTYRDQFEGSGKAAAQPGDLSLEKKEGKHKTRGFNPVSEQAGISGTHMHADAQTSIQASSTQLTLSDPYSTSIFRENYPDENPGDQNYSLMIGLKKSAYRYAVFEFQPLNDPQRFRPSPGSVTRISAFGKFLSMAKPELSFWASPMLSFENSSLAGADENKVHKDYFNKSNSGGKPLFTMNSGVKLQFMILPYMRIGTGIGYFQTGNTYNYDYRINDIPVFDSATGKIMFYIHRPDSQSKHVRASGRHIGKYIEIPLSCRLNVLSSQKFSIELEPSYALQILSGSSGEHIDPYSLDLSSNRSYRTRSGNIQIGVPVSFMMNRKMSFSISPYYGQATRNVSANMLENRQRAYAGIRFSLNYKLYNPTR